MPNNNSSDTTSIFTSSDSFFDQLTIDVQNAQTFIGIQCMTFEADRVGNKLIELLNTKPHLERTLLIDTYSRFVVNDTFLLSPQGILNKNNALHEKRALQPLISKARETGIKVVFTNPMGFLMHKYPARNHKKLVLIDDNVSYVGGLNFSEHNFKWSDLMIRHENRLLNQALKKSFDADLSSREIEPIHNIDDNTRLFVLNGYKTKHAFGQLLERIKSARKVVAVSPYISYPMLDAIAEVEDNVVILPLNNNKGYVTLFQHLKRYKSINYAYSDGDMMHMKLIVIDDDTVIYGSSNFDTISYLFEKEIVLERKDAEIVKQLDAVALNLID